MSPSVSVVIPSPISGRLAPLVGALPGVHEVIVVVGPGEDTFPTLPRAARVIRQTRHGAGNAVACGVAAATGDVVVTLPGDASCDPADLPRLVDALDTGADVAEGVRPARYGDLILLWFMAVLFGCRPTDPGSGFRAFRRDRADLLGLPRVAGTETVRGDGPDGEPLLTVRSRASGLRITEVPVTTGPRTGGSTLVTGLSALAREYLARRREVRAGAVESIVVLTGGGPAPDDLTRTRTAPDLPPGPGSFFDVRSGRAQINPPRISLPRINPPRTPLPDRHPGHGQGPDRWPAPNHAVALSHAGPGGADHPNSAGLGFPDRRRGERRSPERRADGTADRRSANSGRLPANGGAATAAGRFTNDRSTGPVAHRRRWRDDSDPANGRPRGQDRPNLRVINGEGSGSGGSRGHLRPVPRPDQP